MGKLIVVIVMVVLGTYAGTKCVGSVGQIQEGRLGAVDARVAAQMR